MDGHGVRDLKGMNGEIGPFFLTAIDSKLSHERTCFSDPSKTLSSAHIFASTSAWII